MTGSMKVINREVPSEEVSTGNNSGAPAAEAGANPAGAHTAGVNTTGNQAGSTGTSRTADGSKFAISIAAITILSGVLYALLSAYWPKFSRAEVFFAECAREMIATDNYVTPLYHGQAFFDKPILVYWFIIGCFKTLGTTHFAARIPSIIASVSTLIVTALACRAAFGARAALLATMALGTSFMYLSFSALCMSDAMLVMVDTVTLILLYAGFRAREKGESAAANAVPAGGLSRTTLWFLAAASMGFGFLIKGPVAVVLPAVFFLAFLFAEKQLKAIKLRHVLLGALALCVIAAPWFYLAYQANGIEAITYFFLKENVQRFAGSTYDTHRPIWFMVVSLLGGFLPWSIFLPAILFVCAKNFISAKKRPSIVQAEEIAAARFPAENGSDSNSQAVNANPVEQRRVNSLHLFLWLWVAVAIGFFSVSRGKIDYYALPAFPACAVLVGYFLDKWTSENNKFTSAAAFVLNVVLVVVGLGITALLNELPYPPSIPPVAVGAIPVIIGLFGLSQVFKAKQFASYATIFSGVAITGSAFALFAMPVLIKMSPALQYAETIRAADTGNDRTAELKRLVEQKRGLADPTRNLAGVVAQGLTEAPTNAQSINIGMFSGVEHWIDEVTFRTEREPIKLSNADELSAFLSAPGKHWLIIKNSDFDVLPESARRNLETVARHGFIPKSLNPGYILKHRGDLTGGNELILARSK